MNFYLGLLDDTVKMQDGKAAKGNHHSGDEPGDFVAFFK